MSSHQILGKDAEAVCRRHRQLVRWIPSPGWWYHVSDHQTCKAMYGENAPLVWVHNGKPAVMQPGWEARFWMKALLRGMKERAEQ